MLGYLENLAKKTEYFIAVASAKLKATLATAAVSAALLLESGAARADVSGNMTRLADNTVGAAADWTPIIVGLCLLAVGLGAVFGAIHVIRRH